MPRSTLTRIGAVAALALGLSGCFNPGVYRTARTLEPGVGDLNINFSLAKADQTIESQGAEETLEYSSFNIVPEIGYHLGVADNLEVGGRVAPQNLFVELDVKYRFFGSAEGPLHIAVAPHVGYQTAIIAEGPSVGLPLILTYDVGKYVSVNVAGFGRVAFWSENFDSSDDFDLALGGTTTAFGGHLGVELHGETFYLMPTVEYSRLSATYEGTAEGETVETTYDTNLLMVSVNFGFAFGREKQQLDRVENKIDKIDDKLDKALEK